MFKLLSFFTFIVYLMEAHIHATWRIRLNEPSAAAMRPYVELLWPLVVKIASHLDQQLSRDDVTRGCRGNAVHAVRFMRIASRFWGRLQNEHVVVYTVLDVGYSYIRRDVVCLSVCVLGTTVSSAKRLIIIIIIILIPVLNSQGMKKKLR